MKRAEGNLPFLVAVACSTAWLFLATGLFFHHSDVPSVLGRFSRAYTIGLLAFVAAAPVVFLAVRALFSPTLVTRSDGTTRTVGPAVKLPLLAGITALAFALGEAVLLLRRQPADLYDLHPYLQIVPRPNPSRGVNARGFRGRDVVTPKPPGVYRVVLLGGSTTYDPNLPFAESYGFRLEERLAPRLTGRRPDVQCLAASGYNSEHSLIRFATDGIDLDADAVLLMHGINDLSAAAQAPVGFRADYGHQGGLAEEKFHRRIHILEPFTYFLGQVMFSDFFGPPGNAHAPPPDPGPLVRNLRSIVVLARSRGQAPVLCTEPNLYRLDASAADRRRAIAPRGHFLNGVPLPNYEWFATSLAAFNEAARRLAAAQDVPLLDFERAIPPRRDLFSDEVHVTAKGATLEAELAAAFLESAGLLENRPPH